MARGRGGSDVAETVKMPPDNPDMDNVKKAATIIKAGGLVIYPTETCYGLGTNALDAKAVKRVYEAKQREKPRLSIIVSSLEDAEKYCQLTPQEKKVAQKLMPSPLTLVVKKRPRILPANLSEDTIGFRISSEPIAAALAKEVRGPITATSANISGEVPPYSIAEINPKLREKVDIIIDAGELPAIAPSTVAQIKDKKVKIIRNGPVTKKEIEVALG